MKNKKLVITVLILLVICGILFYLDRTCNYPFIKGNINNEGEKIYHTSSGEYYGKTKINRSMSERCFFSEKQAISAGWRASLK